MWVPIMFSPSSKGVTAGRAFLQRIRARRDRDVPVSPEAAAAHRGAAGIWAVGITATTTQLKRIVCPTLVVNGSHDIVIETINSFILQQNIPDAKLVLYRTRVMARITSTTVISLPKYACFSLSTTYDFDRRQRDSPRRRRSARYAAALGHSNELGLNRDEIRCGVARCGACTVHIDGEATVRAFSRFLLRRGSKSERSRVSPATIRIPFSERGSRSKSRNAATANPVKSWPPRRYCANIPTRTTSRSMRR